MRSFKAVLCSISPVTYTIASVICAIGAGIVGGILFEWSAGEWVTAVVGLGAFTISFLAWRTATEARNDSRRAADAAESTAETAKREADSGRHGWSITPDPKTHFHVLRNTGSADAHDVRISAIADPDELEDEDEDDGPNPAGPRFTHESAGQLIRAGESTKFFCIDSFSRQVTDVAITWRSDGETADRTWVETTSFVDHEWHKKIQQRSEARDLRREDQRREDTRYLIEQMINLAEAYGHYLKDPGDPALRLKAQAIAAALPPSLAIEIGYKLDVAKNAYQRGRPGPEDFLEDEDRPLVAAMLPQIDLLWGVSTTAAGMYGDPLHANEDQQPEYTIAHAVEAYIRRVKERESGERPTRWTRKDEAERQALFKDLHEWADSRPTVEPESPVSTSESGSDGGRGDEEEPGEPDTAYVIT